MAKHFRRRPLRGGRAGHGVRAAHGGSLVGLLFSRKVRPAEGPPPKVSQWLARYGKLPIQGLVVCREPINRVLEAVLRNVLPPFAVPYDKLYHLWIHVHLGEPNNQDKWKHFDFEKNEVVQVKEVSAFDPHKCPDHLDVPVSPRDPPLTLIDLFTNARHRFSDHRLWVYDPVHQNCQRFVWDLLSSSGLGSTQLEQFILQDIRKFLKGPAHLVARAATDLASYFRRLSGGKHTMHGGYFRGGNDGDLETALALLPSPDPTIEAKTILQNLPDPAAATLRPPTRDEIQAAQAHEVKRELTKKNAFLNEIAETAARVNPGITPILRSRPSYYGHEQYVVTPRGRLRYDITDPEHNRGFRRLESLRRVRWENQPGIYDFPGLGVPYDESKFRGPWGPGQLGPGELKASLAPPLPEPPTPLTEEDALLAADFDELADAMDLEGDGHKRHHRRLRKGGLMYGCCANCGGAGCAGVAGGCFCHGDKYGIGTAAVPNAYLTGRHPEPGSMTGGSTYGAGFWGDVGKTFKRAFHEAGNILSGPLAKIPVIGAPLDLVGKAYHVISGGNGDAWKDELKISVEIMLHRGDAGRAGPGATVRESVYDQREMTYRQAEALLAQLPEAMRSGIGTLTRQGRQELLDRRDRLINAMAHALREHGLDPKYLLGKSEKTPFSVPVPDYYRKGGPGDRPPSPPSGPGPGPGPGLAPAMIVGEGRRKRRRTSRHGRRKRLRMK